MNNTGITRYKITMKIVFGMTLTGLQTIYIYMYKFRHFVNKKYIYIIIKKKNQKIIVGGNI